MMNFGTCLGSVKSAVNAKFVCKSTTRDPANKSCVDDGKRADSTTTANGSALVTSSQNVSFQYLMPTLTFYPVRTDHIDLYPNSEVNRVLRDGEYIR